LRLKVFGFRKVFMPPLYGAPMTVSVELYGRFERLIHEIGVRVEIFSGYSPENISILTPIR
jgi:hypothetical protein